MFLFVGQIQRLARRLWRLKSDSEVSGVLNSAQGDVPQAAPNGAVSPQSGGFSGVEDAMPHPLLNSARGRGGPGGAYQAEAASWQSQAPAPAPPPPPPPIVEPAPGAGALCLFPNEDPAVLFHYVRRDVLIRSLACS